MTESVYEVDFPLFWTKEVPTYVGAAERAVLVSCNTGEKPSSMLSTKMSRSGKELFYFFSNVNLRDVCNAKFLKVKVAIRL